VAAPIVEKTDIVKKLADYMKLDMLPEAPPAAEGEGASRFSSMELSPEHKIKLAKVLAYFKGNPAALDKMLGGKK
jgi:hypothetical protein